MKRIGNLWWPILDRENLRLAVHKAMRGKRDRAETQRFVAEVDRRLDEMAEQLDAGTFPLGRFHQFLIHDPKERIITAPCFAERVLHHAIMNVCEPHFDRWLIHDSYACRAGKGRLLALERARSYTARYDHFLKMDMRKYFDSIDHAIVVRLLGRRFKDVRLLDLLGRIVGSYRGEIGRGLPIGSLTSQHLANFYLGGFDHHVKEVLKIPGYVRYMDDVVLWSNDAEQLAGALPTIRTWLRAERGLELKAEPYANRTRHGLDFLGCRVHRHHLTLNRASRLRFRRELATLERRYEAGEIDEAELSRRAESLVAFTRTPGLCTWRFRARVLSLLSGKGPRARTG